MELKYTKRVSNIVEASKIDAQKNLKKNIDVKYFLSSLLNDENEINSYIKKEKDLDKLKSKIQKDIDKEDLLEYSSKQPSFDDDVSLIFNIANNIASGYKKEEIDLVSIYEALLFTENIDYLNNIKKDLNYDKKLFDKIKNIEVEKKEYINKSEIGKNFLTLFTTNLNNKREIKSKEERSFTYIREKEVFNLYTILSKSQKNNPFISGSDHRVGSSFLVEGLVEKIIKKEVPTFLKDKQIYKLDINKLYKNEDLYIGKNGDGPKIIEDFVLSLKSSPQNKILFIDDAGQVLSEEKNNNLAPIDFTQKLVNRLLEEKEINIPIIFASTTKKYKNIKDENSVIQRHCEPVILNEPSIEETKAMLRLYKPKLEKHHGVFISDDAIVASVLTSKKHLNQRGAQPDLSIQLLDEVCAVSMLNKDYSPDKIDGLSNKIVRNKIKITSLNKDKSSYAKIKLEKEKENLNQLQVEFDKQTKKENIKKENRQKLKIKRDELENLIKKRNNFIDNNEPKKEIDDLENKIEDKEKKLNDFKIKYKVKEEGLVMASDVYNLISLKTKIPLEQISHQETLNTKNIEEKIGKYVFGQDEALAAISNSLLLSAYDFSVKKEGAPIGSFIFLGSSGVGKTETARVLANHVFGSEHNLIKINMGQYKERHTVSNLIGSAKGYVAYDEGGELVNRVKNNPYSVILLDEIEKAHPEVIDVFLSILDDGKIVDPSGNEVDFSRTIIIMTSNKGDHFLFEEKDEKKAKEKMKENLQEHFRNEFLGRINEKIVFNTLNKKIKEQIVNKFLNRLVDSAKKSNINLTFDNNVIKKVVENSENVEKQGARAFENYINKNIAGKIVSAWASNNEEGRNLNICYENNKLKITSKKQTYSK